MDISKLVRESVEELIRDSTKEEKIRKSFKLHKEKIHFIPPRYRVIGGILQALNIRFGNFIEKLLREIVKADSEVDLVEISGQRIALSFTRQTDALIDGYITSRQLPDSPDNCDAEFSDLRHNILRLEVQHSEKITITKDIDLLFNSGGKFVYVEIKYNDDHDTGKFVDINRKFLKTYAGLVNHLGIENVADLEPILYYLSPIKRWGPIYTPTANVLRGPQLFNKYFATSFEEVDSSLRAVGDDEVVLSLFDKFYQYVRYEMG